MKNKIKYFDVNNNVKTSRKWYYWNFTEKNIRLAKIEANLIFKELNKKSA